MVRKDIYLLTIDPCILYGYDLKSDCIEQENG